LLKVAHHWSPCDVNTTSSFYFKNRKHLKDRESSVFTVFWWLNMELLCLYVYFLKNVSITRFRQTKFTILRFLLKSKAQEDWKWSVSLNGFVECSKNYRRVPASNSRFHCATRARRSSEFARLYGLIFALAAAGASTSGACSSSSDSLED